MPQTTSVVTDLDRFPMTLVTPFVFCVPPNAKLWHLEKIRRLRNTDEPFLPTDPGYNPGDSAMIEIHCRVRA